ncbi:phage/plasmid primase, P4 family [Haemophilus influenzae]|nr:phage/plasmid primase, P4 family [Haemophilus influenzae]
MRDDKKQEFKKTFKTIKDNERFNYFFEWYKKPLFKDGLTNYLYFYNGKKWVLLKDDDALYLVVQFFDEMGVDYNVSSAKTLLELIILKMPKLGKPNLEFIPFSNGVINRNTGEFLPHSKDYFLRSFIDIEYSFENKPMPNFEKWINWASKNDEDKKHRILAAFYMILTNSYQWQLFLEITGDGGSGKSIFNEIAIMLVGEENSTSINLKDLEKISARTKLLDKTLIFAPDQGRMVTDGAVLKALTGGDVMSFEPKYKDPFDARVQSVFLMTNNDPIVFTEHNGGILRRRVIFHFADKVPDHLVDDKLKDKIKNEIPSIVNLLINTFKNDPLQAKRLLEYQRESDEALMIKKKNNHFLRFAEFFETRQECKGLEPGKKQDKKKEHQALYSLYRLYCSYYDETPIKQGIFWDLLRNALKELKNNYPAEKRTLNGEKLTNIYFKTDWATTRNEWMS